MDLMTRENLQELLARQDAVCVSIYLRTARAGEETMQGRIRLKNLLRDAERALFEQGVRKSDSEQLLNPAQGFLTDTNFWQHQSDGLALFLGSGFFRCYRLALEFSELAVVTGRFHVKPLLPFFQNDGRFFVLAISQNEIRLLECTRHGADLVELDDMPANLAEVLEYDDREQSLQFHSGTTGRSGQRRAAIFHGHGGGTDTSKDDLLRYFRRIDAGLKGILPRETVPLLLAGVDFMLPIYREANSYPGLSPESLPGNPELLRPEELHRRAWAVMQPRFEIVKAEVVARYRQLAGTGRTSDAVEEILRAVAQGRVESLLVAVGVQQWGSYDPATRVAVLHPVAEPGDEDLLDLAAVDTLRNRGTVFAVPPAEVPGSTPLAAVFRY